MAATGKNTKEFTEEATCPVCLEDFTNPDTTDCEPNFCRVCLTKCLGDPERNVSCLKCNESVQLKPNRKLADIAEIRMKFGLQVAKGTGGAYKRHQEPLNFFCMDDEAPICVVCDQSKEHGDHQVIPVEEAAEEYKEKIQVVLQSLEEAREKLVEQKVTEEQESQKCLKHLVVEKQEVMAVFKETHKSLEEKERFRLMELADLEEEIKKRQEENMTRLSEEISHLSDLIKDVELQCHQQQSEFLQDTRHTLIRCEEGQIQQLLEMSSRLKWRLQSDSLKSSVLKKAIQDIEGTPKQMVSKVSVTLDPGTAHPQLVLSADLKRVSYGKSKQNLPNGSESFDSMSCVLGHERFTSGVHCWEVEVELEPFSIWDTWAVGIARDSVRRKGWIKLSPDEGVWAVGQDPSKPYVALAYTSPEHTLLTLSHDLRKIKVFLDYEEGRVEFYNADTHHWIFTFPPAFFSGEEIRPFFEVWTGASLKC